MAWSEDDEKKFSQWVNPKGDPSIENRAKTMRDQLAARRGQHDYYPEPKKPEAPKERSNWGRFIDRISHDIQHYGAPAYIARQIDPIIFSGDPEMQRSMRDSNTSRERRAREEYENTDPANGFDEHIVDFLGSLTAGAVDPTSYVGGFGKNLGERAVNAAGINAGIDVLQQNAEIAEGVRDEYDPVQGAVQVGIPLALGGAAAGVRKGVDVANTKLTNRRRSKVIDDWLSEDGFIMPVEGRMTSGVGKRAAPKAGASTNHGGIDLAVPVGTPVRSSADGVVTKVGRGHAKRGNWVEVDYGNGYTSRYLHLSGFNVKPGDTIGRGQPFARSGKSGNVTGPHLHWSMMKDGKVIDPRSAKFRPTDSWDEFHAGSEREFEDAGMEAMNGSTGGPVRPMNPEDIARAMRDEEMGAAIRDGEDIVAGADDDFFRNWDEMPDGDRIRTIADWWDANADKEGLWYDVPEHVRKFGDDHEDDILNEFDVRRLSDKNLTPEERSEIEMDIKERNFWHRFPHVNKMLLSSETRDSLPDDLKPAYDAISYDRLGDVPEEMYARLNDFLGGKKVEQLPVVPRATALLDENRVVSDRMKEWEETRRRNDPDLDDILRRLDDPTDNYANNYFRLTDYEKRVADEFNTEADQMRRAFLDDFQGAVKDAGLPQLREIKAKKNTEKLETEERRILKQYEDHYWGARHLLDLIKKGESPITRGEAREIREESRVDELLETMDRQYKNSKLVPLGKDVLLDIKRVWDEIDALLSEDASVIGRPPAENTGYEKFTPYMEPKKAANDDVLDAMDLIDRTQAPKLPPMPGDEDFDIGNPKGYWSDGPTPTGFEQKLKAAIKKARSVYREQRELRHEELSKRASHLRRLQQEDGGLDNYYQQLGATKGALPTSDFESIAKDFTEADFKEIFTKINNSSLLEFEKLTAQSAVLKLLGAEGGKLPTPSELRHLSEVLSPDVIETLMSNRPFAEKLWHHCVSALNVPRALMASVDISAPFRQGLFLIGRKEFWKSWKPMMKALFSEDYSKDLYSEIKSRSSWQLMKRGGLAITDPHKHFLLDREEDFMTDWAEKIPGWGRVIKASNRAYSGFLNRLRADYFDNLLSKYREAGIDLSKDTTRLKGLTRFINSATGRGDLGRLNSWAPALNALFFSPRLIKARLDMLPFTNPTTYLRADPIIRKEAWKNLFALSGAAMSVLSLASMAGLEVELDPRHPDFAKIKSGNTRYDILGGFQQYMRLGAQILSGTKFTGKGEKRELGGGLNPAPKGAYDESLADILGRFLRSKESPQVSLGHNFLAGENVVGEPFNRTTDVGVPVSTELLERIVPMAIGDIIDTFNEKGVVGAAAATPSLVGIGVQTYDPDRQSKDKDFEDFKKGFASSFQDSEDFKKGFE